MRVLVTEGPARVRELAARGAVFDRDVIAQFSRGGKLLRDDYAPVDQLLALPKGV